MTLEAMIVEACMHPQVVTLFMATLQARIEVRYNDALAVAGEADAAADAGSANVDGVKTNGINHCCHVDHLEIGFEEIYVRGTTLLIRVFRFGRITIIFSIIAFPHGPLLQSK